MKKTALIVAMFLAMLFFILPVAALAAEQTVTTWDELKTALADTSVDSIVLGADLEVTEKLTVSHPVAIDGKNYSIKRVNSYKGTMLEVTADLDMTNVVIDGQNEWVFDKAAADAALANPAYDSPDGSYITPEDSAPSTSMSGSNKALIRVNSASMTTNGVTVKNTYSSDSTSIFAVIGTGNLDLTGATIQHVASHHEATVLLINSADATATIGPGTTISDVYGNRNGIVSRINSGTLYMTGGTITDVKGVNTNGSVFMTYKGTLEMSGGTISNNTAYPGPNNGNGSAIYMHQNSTVIITGGTIKDNLGGISGGIVMLGTATKLEISGGTVAGNTSLHPNYAPYGDVYVVDASRAELTGGTYSQNPNVDWVLDQYVAYDNGDGTWTVMPKSAVPTTPSGPSVDAGPDAFIAAPKTGDNANIALWMGLCALASIGLFIGSKKLHAVK